MAVQAGGADMELKKAFGDLQLKMQETASRLQFADQQIADCKKKIAYHNIAHKQLSSLPDETRMYGSCGRMFILDEKKNILDRMTNGVELNNERIKTFESNKELLKRNAKEAEDNLRELVATKKQSSK